MIKFISYLCFLVISFTLQTQNKEAVIQVQTEKGIIEGIVDAETNLNIFLGVPYAKPPVGKLRWKAPQPLDDWQGVRETKEFGDRAVQPGIYSDMVFRSGMSEDCLYLNIWAPVNQTKLPVLLYIHGGGWIAGDGSELRYDGVSMAQKGIVVVTINYRLNIFGFFAHPELSKESPYKASGNYGLLDQNAAIKWVHDNIAAFGGDSEKITIAGESAGSVSVSTHMVSPLSRDLIAGAIGESGASIYPTSYPIPLKEAEDGGIKFLNEAGVSSIKELREFKTEEIFKICIDSKHFGFPKVLDGYFYPNTLPEVFLAGEQAQVPLLLGWNSAERPGLGFLGELPWAAENYFNKVKEIYPDHYQEALKYYPFGSIEEIKQSATNIGSDRFMGFNTWKWFDLHRKNSDQPVYRYFYKKLRPQSDQSGKDTYESFGAPHACEIEYCMGNLHLVKSFDWTSDDYKVSETMQTYFANFIKTGNPNNGELPNWPRAGKKEKYPKVMIFDTDSKAVEVKDDDRFRFLDTIFTKLNTIGSE